VERVDYDALLWQSDGEIQKHLRGAGGLIAINVAYRIAERPEKLMRGVLIFGPRIRNVLLSRDWKDKGYSNQQVMGAILALHTCWNLMR
jgi:hypothetical protein